MRILVALCVCVHTTGVMLATPQSGAPLRLASIHVKGNQRYTLDDIEQLSGVQIGKTVAPTNLTDAANQLGKTGLFSSVKFSYTTAGSQINVTFEVEEAPSTIPVTFDNFVWMPDDELKTALRADVPEFDGTTTAYAGAPDLIAAGLQKILTARKLPGRVVIKPQFPIGQTQSDPLGFIFSVEDPSPTVCALHVAGASAILEKDLVGQLSGAVGQSYSREFTTAASAGTLTDMYHAKGYWRAAFAPATVALTECDGVAVTLNVHEGAQYVWDHAVWVGNMAMPSAALDKALDMKAGEVANFHTIDDGVRSIHREYGHIGYVVESATYTPQLDDTTHRATFTLVVKEGDQYMMGALEFVGIKDADADKLQKQWHLKAGDVFDESYMTQYQAQVLGPLRSPSGGRPVIGMSLDRAHRIVNLRVAVQ